MTRPSFGLYGLLVVPRLYGSVSKTRGVAILFSFFAGQCAQRKLLPDGRQYVLNQAVERFRCVNYLKNEKILFSCESTKKYDFITTQLCKLRVTLRSRVLRGVNALVKDTYRSVTPLLLPGSTGLRRSALSCARKLYNPH